MYRANIKSVSNSALFNPTLIPRYTKEKGYTYIYNVLYHPLNLNDAIKDIPEHYQEFYCKPGVPNTNNLDFHFGLYLPFQKAYGK